jgi:hypothetical protein
MIAGKVLLFSESAMIRAPYSLVVVRLHPVRQHWVLPPKHEFRQITTIK